MARNDLPYTEKSENPAQIYRELRALSCLGKAKQYKSCVQGRFLTELWQIGDQGTYEVKLSCRNGHTKVHNATFTRWDDPKKGPISI
jgi:hypothetical protein